ncbi:MAG TPA: 6-carboxytetrahydropterin synthase [Burkholderiaceae bacterium]|nr:6-carboxytetrahydropterin synthase [Burkholderiaceae bacterium]
MSSHHQTSQINPTQQATFEVCQSFFFDAAHHLERKIETEGSRRIHGHTYNAEVAVTGPVDPATGMVMDIGFIRIEVAKVRALLDHHLLDEVPGLGIPTIENLCIFIAKTMQANGLKISRVSVWRDGIGDMCNMVIPS